MWFVPREDVDEAALAPLVERHLWAGVPAVLAKGGDHVLGQRSVSGVDEPIEVAGARPGSEIDRNLETVADGSQGADGDTVDMTPLDPGDGRVRDPGAPGDVALPEAAPDPHSPEDRPEAESVHARNRDEPRLTPTQQNARSISWRS